MEHCVETSRTMKRVGIYFFFDQAGVVDKYVLHFIKEMLPSFDSILVVCNGILSSESRECLSSISGVSILVRPNTGFDVWAYRTGLLHLGWDQLSQYDEVVLMNFTIMGPVNSFDDMFAEMADRDLDFWGMTVHNGAQFDPWGLMPEGFIPLHLQSHFIAIRRSMFGSPEFENYWMRMGPIRTYHEAIAKHEALFTQRFERMGFRWASYVETADLEDVGYYPLFNQPIDLIENRRSPVFKRKMFLSNPGAYLDENANQVAKGLFDYLHASGRYDVDLITQHLVRSAHMNDIRASLHLDRVIEPAKVSAVPRPIVAVFLEAEIDGLDSLLIRINASVPSAEIFLLEPLERAQKLESEGAGVTDRPDRLANALGLAKGFELAAYFGASDGVVLFPQTIELARREQVVDSMFFDLDFVDSLFAEFAKNPQLGLVFPPPPIHAGHFGNLSSGWRGQYHRIDAAFKKSEIEVRRSPDRPQAFPESNSFWFRPNALDGNEQILKDLTRDGTTEAVDMKATKTAQLLTLPLLAQSLGFLSHEIMPAAIANNRMATMRYYLERLGAAWAPRDGEYFREFEHALASAAQIRGVSTGVGLRARMYFDTKNGFTEYESVAVEGHAQSDGSLRFEVMLPAGVTSARFDPVDGHSCVCSGASAGLHKIKPVNHRRIRGYDIFTGADPQYQIDGTFIEGHLLVVTLKHLYPIVGDQWMQNLFPTRVRLVSTFGRMLHRLNKSWRASRHQRPRLPDNVGGPGPWIDDFD